MATFWVPTGLFVDPFDPQPLEGRVEAVRFTSEDYGDATTAREAAVDQAHGNGGGYVFDENGQPAIFVAPPMWNKR